MSRASSARRQLAAFASCFHQDLAIEIDEVYGRDRDRWLAATLESLFGDSWRTVGVDDAGGWKIDRTTLKREIVEFLGEHTSEEALILAWIQLGEGSSLPNTELRHALRDVAESL
jgi:hypothetical protein